MLVRFGKTTMEHLANTTDLGHWQDWLVKVVLRFKNFDSQVASTLRPCRCDPKARAITN